MVVNGLHEYMSRTENSSGIRKHVKILAEIEQWKTVKKVPPKILIDIKDVIHAGVQRDDMGQLLGGRYSLHIVYYRRLFNLMKKAKAELVFFAAAKALSDDLSIFIPDREKEYVKHIQILDDIDASSGCTWTYRQHRQDDAVVAPSTMEINLQKIAHDYGVVHTNYFRHNQEIAQYMQQHDGSVLAILSNDTDFMVFDGEYQFWRAIDIDMTELSVSGYCREKLREHLGVDTQQLKLLSALSGSMYLPCDVLMDFYDKIGVRDCAEGRHISRLAFYIRERTQSGDIASIKEQIALDVFGDDYTTHDLNAIENGLIQYNLNFKKRVPKNLEFCKDKNAFIYKLLTDNVYLIRDISFIDYRHFKSKNYAELIIPLLRKVQGILDANEHSRPKTRAVCMKYAHDEPYKVVDELIDYPPMKVPEWFYLIFKSNDDNYDAMRWSLFDWVFDFGQKFNKSLQHLHKRNLTVVIVTLKYLLQQGEISTDEADAFLITENNTRNTYRDHHPRINFPEKLNTHYIRVAHLYTKVYAFIRNCMEVCGLFYYTSQDFIMFDGRYFHKTLEEISECAEQKQEALRSLQKDRLYIA